MLGISSACQTTHLIQTAFSPCVDSDTEARGATGTVHLAQKNLAPVCRKLGIDYAPAMTGFSIRGGRSIPDILGVVVCAEHADAVLQGFRDDERCERRDRGSVAGVC